MALLSQAKRFHNGILSGQGHGSRAVGQMGDSLLEQYRAIKQLVVAADRRDVHARYEIAVRCQEVREGDGKGGKYGHRAVARLAKALGWRKSNVYEFANVAKTWPDKKGFDEFAAQEDKYGKPLSWSHIVLLATMETADAVARWPRMPSRVAGMFVNCGRSYGLARRKGKTRRPPPPPSPTCLASWPPPSRAM